MYFIRQKLKMMTLLTPFILFSSSTYAITVSYDQALKIAFANNPRLKVRQSDVAAAYGLLEQTASARWPKLSLVWQGARSNNPLMVFGSKLSQRNAAFADFGAEQYTGPDSITIKPKNLNHPGYYNNFNAAFQLSVPIYTGGKMSAQQANAKARLSGSQYAEIEARNHLAYDIFQAYEGVLVAKQLITISAENVKKARQYLSITKKLLAQSITIKSDVLLAKNYLKASTTFLSAAQQQAQDQLDQFRLLLGKPQSQYVPQHKPVHRIHNLNIYKQTNQRLTHNVRLKALQASIAANQAQVKLAQADYQPHVNLQLQHEWNSRHLSIDAPANTVALGAQWKLLSFGERSGALQKVTSEAKKAQYEYAHYRNQLDVMFQQTKRAYAQAHKEYMSNLSLVSNGHAIVHDLYQRFGRGLVPLSALIESQVKLSEAKAKVKQAAYKKQLMKARILMLSSQLVSSKPIQLKTSRTIF